MDGPVSRSPANPYEIDVPLKRIGEGWYLVFWRVISADGPPVRGVFTFSVGPNAGPIPQFQISSLSETAATPSLLTARWAMFLSMMTALGLFVLRAVIARPLVQRVCRGTRLRPLTIAFAVAIAVALGRDAGLRADGDGAVRAPLGVVGRRARSADARLVVRTCAPRPRAAARAVRVRCGSCDLGRPARAPAAIAGGAPVAARGAARRRAGAARARRRRSRGADGSARAVDRPFPAAPRRRLRRDRRTDRAARALVEPGRWNGGRRASPWSCRASPLSRSSRCSP